MDADKIREKIEAERADGHLRWLRRELAFSDALIDTKERALKILKRDNAALLEQIAYRRDELNTGKDEDE